MWKFLCVTVFIVATATAGKVPDPSAYIDSLPMMGNAYTNKYAKIAREIVHNSNDTMLATISSQKPIKGYPIIHSVKVADSKFNESSTGMVNFYLQKNDPMYANIKGKSEVSAFFSNETTQSNNQTQQTDTVGYRVFITGFVAKIPADSSMMNETIAAIVDRHPGAVPILSRLNTILCRLEIDQVCVIDNDVGTLCVTSDDYFNADVDV